MSFVERQSFLPNIGEPEAFKLLPHIDMEIVSEDTAYCPHCGCPHRGNFVLVGPLICAECGETFYSRIDEGRFIVTSCKEVTA